MIYDGIKEICQKKGISVRSLEKQAGLKNGAISKWNVSKPTVDNLNRVCKVLETNINEFLKQVE